MRIDDFELERYFERHEHRAAHVLGASDAEPLSLTELLALGGDEDRERWARMSLGYPPVRGSAGLREAIASLYQRVDPDEVLVFAGAEEALFALFATAVGRDDHVVAVTPTYQSHYSLPRGLGAEVTELRLDEGADWALDPARVRAALRPATRAIVLNAPNSPTGAIPTRAQLDEIVALAQERGILLVCDEAYRLSEHDPAERLPHVADVSPAAASVGVMSKAFGLGGLRIGWIACRDAALRERIVAFKHYQSICPAAPSELLAEIALRAADRVLGRIAGIVAEGLPLVAGLVERHPGLLRWTPPRAANVGYVELLDERGAEWFALRALEETGVFVVPSDAFQDGSRHLRMGYARRGIREAVAAIEPFVARLADEGRATGASLAR